MRTWFLACRQLLSWCVLIWSALEGLRKRGEERGRKRRKGKRENDFVSFFIRPLIPSWGPHPHLTLIIFQRPHLQIPSHRFWGNPFNPYYSFHKGPQENILWKNWCWSSNTLATLYEEPTHWKRLWCWERLRAKEEGGDRMRWLDGTIDSMDISLNKLRGIMKDRETWLTEAHGVTKSQTWLKQLNNYTNYKKIRQWLLENKV